MTTRVAFRSFEEETDGTHHPFQPHDIYPDSGIDAMISNSSDVDFKHGIQVPLMTLSPVGAEIDVSRSQDEDFLKPGTEINLKIKIMGNLSDFYGLVITRSYVKNQKKVIGIRWCEEPSQAEMTEEKRKTMRWLCSEAFLPTGMAPNPARFNDFIYFKVLDLSKDGMQLSTSLRNKLLIPGMNLDSMISLPLVGEVAVSFKIKNVRIKEAAGKEVLVLGVSLLQAGAHFYESAGQYLLQFGKGVTPATLKSFGLQPKSVESAVQFSFVKDAKTYLEVLSLRRRAYGKVENPVDDENEDLKWADSYDSKSRIIVGKHNSRCVGTVRLTFHEPGEPSEYDQYVSFPDGFPKVSDMLVSGRLCTEPAYRGKDLFDGLIRQMVLTGVQSKRKYILGSSEGSLAHLYERAGLKRTGIFFERSVPQVIKLEVLLMDVSEVLVGRGISFKWWRRLYRDLFDYVDDYKDFEMNPMDQIRVGLYRFFDRCLRFVGF